MSTLAVNSIIPANAGSEDYFLPRAWVCFDGTGTLTIRGSGNISSVTDLGTGYYQPNFSTSFSGLTFNYMGMTGIEGASSGSEMVLHCVGSSTSSVTVRCSSGAGSAVDCQNNGVGFIN